MTSAETQSTPQQAGEAQADKARPPLFANFDPKACVPFLTSMALHAVLFVVLAAWVLPILGGGMDIRPIESSFEKPADSDSENLDAA